MPSESAIASTPRHDVIQHQQCDAAEGECHQQAQDQVHAVVARVHLVQAEGRHRTSRADGHQQGADRRVLRERQVAVRITVETQPGGNGHRQRDQYQFCEPQLEHRAALAAFQ